MAEHSVPNLRADDSTPEFIECAEVAKIPDEGVIAVNVSGQPIALAKSEGKIFAVDNRCPHMGYPLNRGSVHDGILPLASRDVRSGKWLYLSPIRR